MRGRGFRKYLRYFVAALLCVTSCVFLDSAQAMAASSGEEIQDEKLQQETEEKILFPEYTVILS